MFKRIPGNLDYRINPNKEIINEYGELINYKLINNRFIEIKLFGKIKKIDINCLFLLSWYEINTINNAATLIDKIKFYPVESKILRVTCGYLMIFSEPVYYKTGFRYIPSYPKYAIDINGTIIDTFTNEIISHIFTSSDEYITVNIRSPDKCKNRYIRLHRLLALAWLPNTDFINKPIINHKDGNRVNNKLDNLEWCSYSDNVNHALDIGLTPTQIKMKTRDLITGEIVVYNSAAEMSRILGMNSVRATHFNNRLPGFLYKKRYEIKFLSDDSPWYYDKTEYLTDIGNKSIYTITTVNKETGDIKKFLNVKTFYKTYSIWTKTGKIDDGISVFRDKFPNFDVSYKKNTVFGPYRVIDIHSRKITIFDSMWEAAKYIDKSRTEIQYDLSRRLKFIYSNKWIIVPGICDVNIDEYKVKPCFVKKIQIVNISDNTKILADSIKHAARLIGFDPKTITKHLDTENVIKGYLFRALE